MLLTCAQSLGVHTIHRRWGGLECGPSGCSIGVRRLQLNQRRSALRASLAERVGSSLPASRSSTRATKCSICRGKHLPDGLRYLDVSRQRLPGSSPPSSRHVPARKSGVVTDFTPISNFTSQAFRCVRPQRAPDDAGVRPGESLTTNYANASHSFNMSPVMTVYHLFEKLKVGHWIDQTRLVEVQIIEQQQVDEAGPSSSCTSSSPTRARCYRRTRSRRAASSSRRTTRRARS